MSKEFFRIGCSFQLVTVNQQNIKHVSLTLPNFGSGAWLRPPGTCPVVCLHGLSSLNKTNVNNHKYVVPIVVQYLDTNLPYLKRN